MPLITIEWSHSGEFELNENDADILVQISGGDVMWQKERLLNIALDYLPPQAKYVAWIDCDVILENTFWYLEAIELLKSNDVIQLFDEAYLLKPNNKLIINVEIAKLMPYEKKNKISRIPISSGQILN